MWTSQQLLSSTPTESLHAGRDVASHNKSAPPEAGSSKKGKEKAHDPQNSETARHPGVEKEVEAEAPPQYDTPVPPLRHIKNILSGSTPLSAHRISDATEGYDYMKKYPKDGVDQAMDSAARVWRVYLDEAAQFDSDRMTNYNDTVNMILVFVRIPSSTFSGQYGLLITSVQAALFSAVVTTFATQAALSLQPDYTQIMASILSDQFTLQRAIATGSPIPVPTNQFTSMQASTISISSRWINGLWFTSLAFSLMTAIGAMLVKQWIQSYVTPVSGTPQTQARIRQHRFLGFEEWKVEGTIGLLPYFLHLSLLLFFAGLIVYLFPLDFITGSVLVAINASAIMLYLLFNILPVFSSRCPYKTPLGAALYSIGCWLWWSPWPLWLTWKKPLAPQNRQKTASLRSQSFSTRERSTIRHKGDELDALGLCWLTTESSNPSVRAIVVQAVGSLRIGFTAVKILQKEGVLESVCSRLRMCYTPESGVDPALRAQFDECVLAQIQLGFLDDHQASKGPGEAKESGECAICHEVNRTTPRCGGIIRETNPALQLRPSTESKSYDALIASQADWAEPSVLVSRAGESLNLPRIIWIYHLDRASQHIAHLSQSNPLMSTDDFRRKYYTWATCRKLLKLIHYPILDTFDLLQAGYIVVYLAELSKAFSSLDPIPRIYTDSRSHLVELSHGAHPTEPHDIRRLNLVVVGVFARVFATALELFKAPYVDQDATWSEINILSQTILPLLADVLSTDFTPLETGRLIPPEFTNSGRTISQSHTPEISSSHSTDPHLSAVSTHGNSTGMADPDSKHDIESTNPPQFVGSTEGYLTSPPQFLGSTGGFLVNPPQSVRSSDGYLVNPPQFRGSSKGGYLVRREDLEGRKLHERKGKPRVAGLTDGTSVRLLEGFRGFTRSSACFLLENLFEVLERLPVLQLPAAGSSEHITFPARATTPPYAQATGYYGPPQSSAASSSKAAGALHLQTARDVPVVNAAPAVHPPAAGPLLDSPPEELEILVRNTGSLFSILEYDIPYNLQVKQSRAVTNLQQRIQMWFEQAALAGHWDRPASIKTIEISKTYLQVLCYIPYIATPANLQSFSDEDDGLYNALGSAYRLSSSLAPQILRALTAHLNRWLGRPQYLNDDDSDDDGQKLQPIGSAKVTNSVAPDDENQLQILRQLDRHREGVCRWLAKANSVDKTILQHLLATRSLPQGPRAFSDEEWRIELVEIYASECTHGDEASRRSKVEAFANTLAKLIQEKQFNEDEEFSRLTTHAQRSRKSRIFRLNNHSPSHTGILWSADPELGGRDN